MDRLGFSVCVALFLTLLPIQVSAQTRYASQDRAEAALGHYARARAMLIEALSEFEQGERLARPDMLLNTDEWRLSVISRAEDLNRVLDPQPRVTRSGVRYKAGAIRIRHESRQLPSPKEGPYQSSDVGEKLLRVQKQARKKQESVIVKKPAQVKPIEVKPAPPVVKTLPPAKKPEPKQEEKLEEKPEVSSAIEAVIRERLKELEEAEQAQEF